MSFFSREISAKGANNQPIDEIDDYYSFHVNGASRRWISGIVPETSCRTLTITCCSIEFTDPQVLNQTHCPLNRAEIRLLLMDHVIGAAPEYDERS
jgi:hypothetical protein